MEQTATQLRVGQRKFVWASVCTLLLLTGHLFAQGVTTAAMNGVVADSKGEPCQAWQT